MSGIAEGLYQREFAHRALPWPLAARGLVRIAERRWDRDETARREALAHMSFVVGNSERAAEVDDLARRYLQYGYLRRERRWRPWISLAVVPHHAERLRKLAADRRGVVLSFLHLGDHIGSLGALGRVGLRLHMASHPDFIGPDASVEAQQIVRLMSRDGGKVFSALGSREYIRSLLADGEIVCVASDMTGSMPMTILGREVRAASGAARLALDTGAWIVPVTAHHRGLDQWMVVEEPIDPRDHTDPAAVQAEIGRRHEPALLAWPEAFERPLRRWRPTEDSEFAWSQGTTLTV